MQNDNFDPLLKAQIDLEMSMYGAGIARFEKNNERSSSVSASEADWFRRLTREFIEPMSKAVNAYLEHYDGRRTLDYLRQLNPNASSFIAIRCIFDSLHDKSANLQVLATTIGTRIEDEVRFSKLEDLSPRYIGAIKESLRKRSSKTYGFEHDSLVHAEKELKTLSNFDKLKSGGVNKDKIKSLLKIDDDKYESLDKKKGYAMDINRWVAWPQNDIIQIGARLIDIFANNVLLNGKPLVAKSIIDAPKKKTGAYQTTAALVPTDELDEWISKYKEAMGVMAPNYEPCIYPPRDWVSPTEGGYHTPEVSSKMSLVKTRNKTHLKRLTFEQMPENYKCINKLQSAKWEVNKQILKIAQEIRLRGLPLGMPSVHKMEPPACPVPSIYSDLRGEELKAVLSEKQWLDFMAWKRDTYDYHNDEGLRKGEIREVLAVLSQAEKFKNHDGIYFVYSMDFRSRYNAHGSLISPQGGDLQKALITPSSAVPLGERGEYWMMVHGANIWGESWDKEEFDTRVANVQNPDFIDMCLDIAADPVTFTSWANADKPWQFLSWCYEYARLIEWKEEGNKASDFLCRVIVAMDGSCSGIQHYSAMLRDEIGGKEVNLVPSSKPRDIYKAVAEVGSSWMEDIQDNNEKDVPIWGKLEEKYGYVSAYKLSALWLSMGITRDLAKKPVMTLPYGSTQLTCLDSVRDYVKKLKKKEKIKADVAGVIYTESDEFSNLDESSSFASMFIWNAISSVVVAARSGMAFIKGVAGEVAKAGLSLEWVTPTGFIVNVMAFKQDESGRVNTQLLGKTTFKRMEDTKEIDRNRIVAGAPPHFIHSYDATHLTKVVCAADDAGIDFLAVIHDSFGTHAGETEKARPLYTNTFVDMYQEHDALQEFKDYNEARLGKEIATIMPAKGSLDLEVVRGSDYMFS